MSTLVIPKLIDRIEQLAASDIRTVNHSEALADIQTLLECLNAGEIRAASRDHHGTWIVHSWVKKGILMGFRLGTLTDQSSGRFPFFDKHTLPIKPVTLSDGIRLVPGGSSVRSGAYLSRGVICMPPMYINVGAYVDCDTMIDSHALVGSCAQIGKRVHISAAAQIGGVLEPPGARPVIVEDDVFIGGGCGIYEGFLIRERAVLAPGVILTGATPIYDTTRGKVYTEKEVPIGAVVVPGSRELTTQNKQLPKLSVYAPLIVKYRDTRTDAATALETALR